MLVYRYEDRKHVGPFAHHGLNRRYAQLPTAQDEGLPFVSGTHASACTSYTQLVAYFGINNCNAMEDMGYMVAEYEVCDSLVIAGQTQCVFNIDLATFRGFEDEE